LAFRQGITGSVGPSRLRHRQERLLNDCNLVLFFAITDVSRNSDRGGFWWDRRSTSTRSAARQGGVSNQLRHLPHHPTNRALIGPSLFGVVNRPAGHEPGFHYSEANKNSGLTWDPATLDRYLAAPRQVVPGTFMTFPGLKDPSQRAEVIAFLETLH
jgi:hypothetical protein